MKNNFFCAFAAAQSAQEIEQSMAISYTENAQEEGTIVEFYCLHFG